MTPLIAIEQVSKSYTDGQGRREVLGGFSLALAPGETVALCGPSGSGKTTVLQLCAGLAVPDSGAVWLETDNGRVDLATLPEARRTRVRRAGIGYVFQFFNLVPTLTVRENVLLPLALTGRRGNADAALARLESLGLGARLAAFPDALSGGERQRVAIARALAHAPRVVLADEPTGNLDAENGARVVDLLWREVRALGACLVIATHDPAVAARADRIVRL
jgi:putative ABC transport system ATP-binding protein